MVTPACESEVWIAICQKMQLDSKKVVESIEIIMSFWTGV